MLTVLLLIAAAQPAAAAPAEASIDVTASLIAYRDWRLCLDSRLGPPPRARPPKRKALEESLAACASHEQLLQSALATAFGPTEGAEMFAKFARDTRAEIARAR